ncbi:hypothetical protein DACRYDRAFT_114783 [Dacryopinax primogenitus]|uniref:Uncharacterized protein n=1 Tax=Dacryopinax primogenitus (strain DJM 731) TaxID=1858805 RepID=M5GDE2_DACPD|nr:uncharacterized protein DACRYDRAFT_114783 [Dacryopinax primogenitus]EJU04462.1 hypothetical protein DACRYDRAFT_114783 [Dacryopinax primogenitus]
MRQPFFPRPFRITQYEGSVDTTDTPRKRRRITKGSGSDSYVPTGDDLSMHRMEATLRLQTCWWSLADKYSTPLDKDDEVDLFTGQVVRDRGFIRGMERVYELGDLLEGSCLGDDEYAEGSEGGYSVGGDGGSYNIRRSYSSAVDSQDDTSEDEVALSEDLSEDELGSWGEYSGLDYQYRVVPPLSAQMDSEDERDLREFEEAEKALREKFGHDYLEDHLSGEELLDTASDDLSDRRLSDDEMTSYSVWSEDEFSTFELGEGSAVRIIDDSDDSDELNSFLD